jgi:hypothetical protein
LGFRQNEHGNFVFNELPSHLMLFSDGLQNFFFYFFGKVNPANPKKQEKRNIILSKYLMFFFIYFFGSLV